MELGFWNKWIWIDKKYDLYVYMSNKDFFVLEVGDLRYVKKFLYWIIKIWRERKKYWFICLLF